MQPLCHIFGDAVEQERPAGPSTSRAALSRRSKRAIEQNGRSGIFAAIGHAALVRSTNPPLAIRFETSAVPASLPLEQVQAAANLVPMDAEASPSRSIAGHLRGALRLRARCVVAGARGSRSTSRCRRCAWPAANRSTARASAPNAGRSLSFIAPPYCPRLGIPFVYDPGPELLSMEAIANPPAYQRARAAVRYDDVARTLVHALKYQDRTDLAPAMGRWMARAGRELLGEADVLVPVPLHWRRGWSRRYNQSGALARVIERQTGVRLAAEALRRVRPTEQQIGLSRSQRAQQCAGRVQGRIRTARPTSRAAA